jgi:hypothetical protein
MATLYISEYSTLYVVGGLEGQMPRTPPIAQQNITIGGVSVQSAPFNVATKLIRLHTDVVCSIAIGGNPTATVANARFAANQTEFWGCNPGDRVAVISNT